MIARMDAWMTRHCYYRQPRTWWKAVAWIAYLVLLYPIHGGSAWKALARQTRRRLERRRKR